MSIAAAPAASTCSRPTAACLGVIRMPEYTANFCFGDDDLRSLYVTASTSLYRLRVKTPGTPNGHDGFGLPPCPDCDALLKPQAQTRL